MRAFRHRLICWKLIPAILAAASALAGGAAHARAQEAPRDLTSLSVEELMKVNIDTVSTASKSLQKVTKAPASVSIITADAIQKYGYRTLADILRSVRGFYVLYDRNYSYLGVRGFGRSRDYNSRILLLVDGHRVNDNVFDGALLGTEFPVDIDLIERVEVVRGPSSALYGTSAFFAVVNVITKQGRNLDGWAASAEAGSFDSYKGRLSYGSRFRSGLEMLLSGTFYDSQGQRRLFFPEFDDPATNNGIAENADDDQSHSFFARLSYGDFHVQTLYGSREKGIPTAAFGTVFNDPGTRTTDARGYLDVKYDHRFDNRWQITADLYYDRYYYTGSYLYDYAGTGAPPFVENRDVTHGAWWGLELTASKTLRERHAVMLGMEFRDNLRQDQQNYDVEPFFSYLDDRRGSKVWAFYAQDEFAIRPNLFLNAGVRADHYETFGATINPRLGLVFTPRETTAFKLLYGQAFRAPSAFELHYTSSSAPPGPSLGPETVKTTELIVEHYVHPYLRLSVGAFHNRLGNLIAQETDQAGRVLLTNLEDVRGKGVELSLAGKWPRGFEGGLKYTVQGSGNSQTGDVLTNSPHHLGKANLVVPLVREKLFAGLEGQYTSRRRTTSGVDAGGFFVANFTLFGRKLASGLDLSASVYNLFDKRYADPAGEEHEQQTIPQDGRSFRLKLTYRF